MGIAHTSRLAPWRFTMVSYEYEDTQIDRIVARCGTARGKGQVIVPRDPSYAEKRGTWQLEPTLQVGMEIVVTIRKMDGNNISGERNSI
mmetsp:Transcript_25860/g.72164  ORF Transcript_25860/g.72164 Transcript_25860/m.72164 type:complete len:89 (+) Transcript_25860:263-529(+)